MNILGFDHPMTFDEAEIINTIAAGQLAGMTFAQAVAYADQFYRGDICHRNDGGEDGASGQAVGIGTGDYA